MHYCSSSCQNKCRLCTETCCQMVTARKKSLPLIQCLRLPCTELQEVGKSGPASPSPHPDMGYRGRGDILGDTSQQDEPITAGNRDVGAQGHRTHWAELWAVPTAGSSSC